MQEWSNRLVEDVSAWPGVSCHEHQFGGTEFRIGAREIGHIHNFGVVDIPFTVKIRDSLICAGLAERHHWLPKSGWATVRVKEHGAQNARSLLRLSYLRIEAKCEDSLASLRAQSELETFAIDPDVLAAVGVSVPVARR